ncbi:MAG: tetratricopeptide repeat protein [Bryobacteraceae bacterium]|nr:tetratricopeptide repeat protein [Bryobacteraceae bacterium]
MTIRSVLSFPAVFTACLLLAPVTLAFQTGGSTAPPGGGTGGGTAPPGGGAGGGTPSKPTTPSPTQPSTQPQRFPTQQQPQEFRRPIFLSGKLMTDDGTPPPEAATIELYCNGRSRPFGYSDSKGRFNITLGGQQPMMMGADASVGSMNEGFDGRSGGFGGMSGGPGSTGISERELMGCELRAVLPGYLSETVQLSGRRFMDNPDLGTILMRRLGKVEARTVSMTSANAPKDARKAFEKGLDRNKKQKFGEAQTNLAKAVSLHPQYAEAWYELGLAYEGMKKPDEAADAFKKSIEADPKYVKPHLAMLGVSLASNNWEKVLDTSGSVLKLDPYSYPQAWYFNSLAHLQLQHFDDAEKSARETIKMDRDKRYPKVHHILGVALANKNDLKAAAGSLKTYIEMNPNGRDSDFVKKQLADIEQRIQQQE